MNDRAPVSDPHVPNDFPMTHLLPCQAWRLNRIEILLQNMERCEGVAVTRAFSIQILYERRETWKRPENANL
jgi:hypothetical protein